MSTLRELFDNNETELALPEDVITHIRGSANARYYNMVMASGNEVYLSTFFIDPRESNQSELHVAYAILTE